MPFFVFQKNEKVTLRQASNILDGIKRKVEFRGFKSLINELMLITNPIGRKHSRSNLEYVAPYSYSRHGHRIQVAGHVKKIKNPKGGKMAKGMALGLPKDLFAGMDLMDMGAAAGGLVAATVIPNAIIKTSDTTVKKAIKVAIALGGAALAGFVFAKVSPKSAKFAVAGGVAGALVQAITAFTPVKIGGVGVPSIRHIEGPAPSAIGQRYPAPSNEHEFQGVRLS